MRILIVDDDSKKTSQLLDYLVKTRSLKVDQNFSVVSTGLDARNALSQEVFDLLLLDIRLPMRPGDEPDEKTSKEILIELGEKNNLRRPRQIVGLTAYENSAAELAPLFAQTLWTIVKYDPTSDEWLDRIKCCVKYIQEARQQSPTYLTDLCIVNALGDPEAVAVHRLPWNWGTETPLDDTTFYRSGFFESNSQKFSVASVIAPSMGMVSTALISSKVISALRPRFLVMGGICAGVKSKVDLGDIVLAERTWDYQSGKRTRDKENAAFSMDPRQLDIPHFIKSRAELLRTDRALLAKIKNEWPDTPKHELKMVIGPMASGSAVLADGEVVAEIKNQVRSLLAIEMEAFGLYAAAHLAARPRPTAFAIKSVCDFADPDKDDAMQKYAAHTSAQSIRIFFERYMFEIKDLAGT